MPLASSLAGGLMLVAVAAPAAAVGGSYPAVEVLEAFRAACPTRAAAETAIAGGAVPGWTKVDAATTPVAELVAFGIGAASRMMAGSGRILGGATYRRVVAGETLYLVASGVDTDGVTVQGCRLYDPGEQRGIAKDTAERWMKRPPGSTVDQPQFGKMTWEPGISGGQDSFDIYRVPAGSPVIALTKIDGIALKADWVTRAASDATKREGQEEEK